MNEVLDYLRELNTASVALRLVCAMAFGGVIGMERIRKRKPAGFRTYMLVCMGAALTMILSQYEDYMLKTRWLTEAAALDLKTDVCRFGAQVINGIGFLGAGTILVTRKREVKGITTAAGLWAAACMGLAIGAGFYECVFFAFIFISFSMRPLSVMEKVFIQTARNMDIFIEFKSLENLGEIVDCIRGFGASIYDIDIDRGEGSGEHPNAVISLKQQSHKKHAELVSALASLQHVYNINEL